MVTDTVIFSRAEPGGFKKIASLDGPANDPAIRIERIGPRGGRYPIFYGTAEEARGIARDYSLCSAALRAYHEEREQ
jgi:hypothetical protein